MSAKTMNLFDYTELEEYYDSMGRKYVTPEGVAYPSITTILGRQPKPGLDKWKKEVGEDRAKRIMAASAKVGTEFHDACERYVTNQEAQVLTNGAAMLFNTVRKTLDRIDNIRGVEIPMWSDHLKVAGRSDCIAEFDGELAIIDYKNSRGEKPRRWCRDYFLQGAAYSRMAYERFGVPIKKTVIIIAQWGEMTPTIYIENVRDWVKPLDDVMRDYNPLWGVN